MHNYRRQVEVERPGRNKRNIWKNTPHEFHFGDGHSEYEASPHSSNEQQQ